MAKQVIHLSDGTNAVCGAKGNKAVKEDHKVTCGKCLEYLENQAKKKNDPLVWCQIYNRDLPDGTDFQFTFEGKLYHIVSGGTIRIPQSLIVHLRSLHYPTPKYEQGESGGAIKVEGTYHRFIVNELSDDEVKVKKAG
jgi:hypothetical protein